MSEQEDQEDRTEAPSAGRLNKSYNEGSIPLSRDIVALASMGGASITLVLLGKSMSDSLIQLFAISMGRLASGSPLEIGPALVKPLWLGAAVCLAAAVGAVVATIIQTKGGFWTDLAMPKLDRVLPTGGKFGQMFSKDKAVDLIATLVKSLAVAWVLWSCLRDEIVTLPEMFHMEADGLLTALFRPLAGALTKLLTVLTILAGLDFALVKYRFTDKLKMTKQEVKREAKEEEGDPMIKGRRRAKHRELIKNQIRQAVPAADVVVVNPTHVAVVLRYKAGEDPAPRVTAKGKGEAAEMIRSLAREHGIPIVENIPLARLLFRKVKVGRMVPADTFKTVAAILAFVYRTLGRSKSSNAQEVSL